MRGSNDAGVHLGGEKRVTGDTIAIIWYGHTWSNSTEATMKVAVTRASVALATKPILATEQVISVRY